MNPKKGTRPVAPTRSKDPAAVKIGKRIQQARRMAGFATQAALTKRLKGWGRSTLGGYEAGFSTPHPDHVGRIARLTGTSACWIMFGVGPIGSGERDLQAVRYQNLVYLVQQTEGDPVARGALVDGSKLGKAGLAGMLDNPFQKIGHVLARGLERAAGRGQGWLDEQHVESDGLCASFPDELRELMSIYSEIDADGRGVLMATARALGAKG